jgi:hypothetical protein
MDKFSRYLDFLDKETKSKEADIKLINREIEINKKIIALLNKRQNSIRVGIKEYEDLAKLSCPNTTIPEIFLLDTKDFKTATIAQDLYGFSGSNFESNSLEYTSCHERSCATCWKNYINRTIDAINKSPLRIKSDL